MTERLSKRAAGLRPASVKPDPPERSTRFELRCTGCGYGAVASAPPTQCPMCGGLDWDFDDWRPFSARGSNTDSSRLVPTGARSRALQAVRRAEDNPRQSGDDRSREAEAGATLIGPGSPLSRPTLHQPI
jgi:hypothetical protein